MDASVPSLTPCISSRNCHPVSHWTLVRFSTDEEVNGGANVRRVPTREVPVCRRLRLLLVSRYPPVKI